MPLFVFDCADGHRTERLCSLDLKDAPKLCDVRVGKKLCAKRLKKALTSPSSHFPGAASWRNK